MNRIETEDIYRYAGQGTHDIVIPAGRITIPAREVIVAAGGTIREGSDGLVSVLLEKAHGLGLIYCQTPRDRGPGYLTPALRLADEPPFPAETWAQSL